MAPDLALGLTPGNRRRGGRLSPPQPFDALAAPYSLTGDRRLLASWMGAHVRFRRGSDDDERDFAAGTDGWVSAAGSPFAPWLGAATGYLITRYDQTGQGRHWTQSVKTQQPLLGVVNGRVVAIADGTDDRMLGVALLGFGRAVAGLTVGMALRLSSLSGSRQCFTAIMPANNVRAQIVVGSPNAGKMSFGGRSVGSSYGTSPDASPAVDTWHRAIGRHLYATRDASIMLDGAVAAGIAGYSAAALSDDADAFTAPSLWTSSAGANPMAGSITALALYNSALSDPDRAALDTALASCIP